MQRGSVQPASSQICSVKLSPFKRSITTATQELKGKHTSWKRLNESKDQAKKDYN